MFKFSAVDFKHFASTFLLSIATLAHRLQWNSLYLTSIPLAIIRQAAAQSHEALQKETLDRGVQVVDMDKYSAIDIYSVGMIYFKNLGNF